MKAAAFLLRRAMRRGVGRRMLAVLSVAAGVSLAMAVNFTVSSINTSAEEFARTVAGDAPIRVTGLATTGAVTPEIVNIVRGVDGVASARPSVQVLSSLVVNRTTRRSVLVLGVGCEFPQIAALGCTEAALASLGDAPLAMGPAAAELARQGAKLRTNVTDMSLADVASRPELSNLNDGRVVVLSVAAAQRQFGRSVGVDSLGVVPATGSSAEVVQSRIATALAGKGFVANAAEAPVEIRVALAAFLPTFGLLGLFALAISVVLVYGTVVLSLEERRSQSAMVAAIGASTSTMAAATLGEVAIIGLLGGVLGGAGGAAIAVPMLSAVSSLTRGSGLTPEIDVPASGIVLAGLIGLAVSVAAAALPVYRSRRIDIVGELTRRDTRSLVTGRTSYRRLGVSALVSAICCVGLYLSGRGGGIEPWQMQVGFASGILLTIATLLGAQPLAGLVSRLFRPMLRRRGGSVWLARERFESSVARSGAVVVAVASAVGLSVAVGSLTTSVRAAVDRNVGSAQQATTYSERVSNEMVERTISTSGVATTNRVSSLLIGDALDNLYEMVASDFPDGSYPVRAGSIDHDRFARGDVVIGAAFARRTGARVGGAISISGPLGSSRHTVMAIWEDGTLNGNVVSVYRRTAESLFGKLAVGAMRWTAVDGLTGSELASRLEGAMQPAQVDLRDRDELVEALSTDVNQQVSVFWVLQRCLLLIAFVSVSTTLVLAGLQLRREMAVLGAIGFGPGEIGRSVIAEGAIAGVVGSAIGIGVGALISWGMLQITPFLVGFRDPVVLNVSTGLASGALTVTVVIIASLFPAWRAAHAGTVAALSSS